MNQTLTALATILTYGALWGITEASIGHLLHITGFFYGWLFWFPAAYVFMHQAYRRTGNPSTAIGAAIVAASIKLIDLLAPVRLDFVINPAVSILLEGAVMCVAFGLHVQPARKWNPGAVGALVMSMAWRGLYLLYALVLVPADWRAISPLISTQALLQFMVVESVINALFIATYSWSTRTHFTNIKDEGCQVPVLIHPAISLLLLLAAVIVQWKF